MKKKEEEQNIFKEFCLKKLNGNGDFIDDDFDDEDYDDFDKYEDENEEHRLCHNELF